MMFDGYKNTLDDYLYGQHPAPRRKEIKDFGAVSATKDDRILLLAAENSQLKEVLERKNVIIIDVKKELLDTKDELMELKLNGHKTKAQAAIVKREQLKVEEEITSESGRVKKALDLQQRINSDLVEKFVATAEENILIKKKNEQLNKDVEDFKALLKGSREYVSKLSTIRVELNAVNKKLKRDLETAFNDGYKQGAMGHTLSLALEAIVEKLERALSESNRCYQIKDNQLAKLVDMFNEIVKDLK